MVLQKRQIGILNLLIKFGVDKKTSYYWPMEINAEATELLPDHIVEYTNAYLHLWVDTNVKLMYTEWLQAPGPTEYREAANLFLQYLQKYAVEYWFMDSNRLNGLSLDEQRQIIHKLAPAVASSTLKKVARIISQDTGNRVMFEETINELQNKYKATVEIKQFWTYNEAANWIAVIRA